MRLELTTYTPSEAVHITGVKQDTVRNWRRAGHLPKQQGHARYNLADMLRMFVMGLLVSRGMSPEAAKEFSGQAARAIFQSTIFSKKTFSEPALSQARKECGGISKGEVDRLKEALGEDFDADMVVTARSQDILVKAAENLAGISGLKHPTWFIVWANGESQFYYDEDISEETFFGNTVFDEYVQGPVTMFCLGALGQMVIDRLPRPAIGLLEDQT